MDGAALTADSTTGEGSAATTESATPLLSTREEAANALRGTISVPRITEREMAYSRREEVFRDVIKAP